MEKKNTYPQQGLKEEDRLVDVFEAERRTGRKASTWRRDILMKKIPVVRLGRLVRIRLSTIQDMIRKGSETAV